MKGKIISITIDEELLESIDNICKDYTSQKKSRYTRSQFFTDATLFLIAYSQEHSQVINKKEEDN